MTTFTNHIISFFTSKAGWASFGTALFAFLTWVAPILPPVWGGLASAICAVLATYHIGATVSAVRGVK